MYVITDYTKRRAKEIDMEVRPSTRRGKKIDVYQKGVKIASIGDTRYKDYPTLQEDGKAVAEEHRRRYHQRHTKDTLGERLALWLLW